MIELLLKLLAAYLIGGLMGGDVMRWLRGGVDLRQSGSGNVGATNALRTRGKGFAAGVLLIDIGKGVFASLVVPALHWPGAQPAPWPQLEQGFLCGVAVALGHCYPLFQKFRGGKGVATLAGVFGALLPAALPWMLLVFVLAVILTGYVAVASIGGAVAAYTYVALFDGGARSAAGLFTLAMLLLVVFKHRENIARLLKGGEHRFDKAMILHKWLAR
ncbi:MAG: glycerol-3-phosphate 1-O-acyltransferase PlsY [Nevskia sp.]|nr:glycerol-3-phosphate 1-O-acyltransferase PlsY [Nevskia sp.]